MSITLWLVLQPVLLSLPEHEWFLWGSLSLLQTGADGREAEGCGTVALLLEHSFEIGEISVSSALCMPFGGKGRKHRWEKRSCL